MRPLLFHLSGAAELSELLCAEVGMDPGASELRRFPDEESYVRLCTAVEGRDVILLCALDRPDGGTLPALFAADAARRQGARSIGLVAPYLPYLRQDRAFAAGEAVTSVTYARLLSEAFDWLVTVDPHLHRYRSLDAVYSIPAHVATAAVPIAAWIEAHVRTPVLIGPDRESGQWVNRIAKLGGWPAAVLRKRRRGDFAVEITGGGDLPAGSTPVVVDDVASTGTTLVQAALQLHRNGQARPVCVVVHAILAGDACKRLRAAGVREIVSANTVAHSTNRIDVGPQIAAAVARALLTRTAR